jgi:hypothetical protein
MRVQWYHLRPHYSSSCRRHSNWPPSQRAQEAPNSHSEDRFRSEIPAEFTGDSSHYPPFSSCKHYLAGSATVKGRIFGPQTVNFIFVLTKLLVGSTFADILCLHAPVGQGLTAKLGTDISHRISYKWASNV